MIEHSKNKIAKFGIMLRDMHDPLSNIFMEYLIKHVRMKSEQKRLTPMGNISFNGEGHTTRTTLGSGDKQFVQFSLHGELHRDVCNTINTTL